MAYNRDFNLYINEAIKEAGYPVDEVMDWAKWIESVYSRSMPKTPEDIRDEGIHNTLITLLFERKILERFDSSRMPEVMQARPIEKQISSYMKMALIKNIEATRKYISKVYHTDEEFPASGLGDEDATLDKIFEDVSQHETHDAPDSFIHDVDVQKLSDAFHDWIDSNDKIKENKKNQLKSFFDIIIASDATSQSELLQAFADQQGLSKSRASQILYIELPKYLRQFSETPEGKVFSLGIPALIEESRHELEAQPETAPILEEEPMSKNTSKYAQFQHIAAEEPAALSEALVELSQAFSTLAEASEALVENLDLTPVAPDAPVKEKTAARKKFARMLKKLASDNPEAVEEAVNEIYNAVDEVAAAIENLADNMGFDLHEIHEEPVEEFEEEFESTPEEDEIVYQEEEEA